MTPRDFASKVRQLVVEENLSIYKDLFHSTNVKDATDEYWIRSLQFFNRLTENDQRVLFEIIRQVMVDTVSNIFAILDGVSPLENQQGEICLLEESTASRLNGDLQDFFLELEERD